MGFRTTYCPVDGTPHRICKGFLPPTYAAYRRETIRLVAGTHGKRDCRRALKALRQTGPIDVHEARFRELLRTLAVLSPQAPDEDDLVELYVGTLTDDVFTLLAKRPSTFEEATRMARDADAKAHMHSEFGTRTRTDAGGARRTATVAAFSAPQRAPHAVHNMSHLLNSAVTDVDFLQTLASLTGVPLNLSHAVHMAPTVVSDLRADLATRVARAGSAVELCNAITHLMPAELTQETASSRKTISRFDLPSLDKGNVHAQRALRRQIDRFKSADASDSDDEPAAPPPKRARTRKQDIAALEEVVDEDDENMLLSAAAQQTVAALVQSGRASSTCACCKLTGHRWNSCPELLTEGGGRDTFCPFCSTRGHVIAQCDALKNFACTTCGVKGHTRMHCPKIVCTVCKQIGHPFFRCPSK